MPKIVWTGWLRPNTDRDEHSERTFDCRIVKGDGQCPALTLECVVEKDAMGVPVWSKCQARDFSDALTRELAIVAQANEAFRRASKEEIS